MDATSVICLRLTCVGLGCICWLLFSYVFRTYMWDASRSFSLYLFCKFSSGIRAACSRGSCMWEWRACRVCTRDATDVSVIYASARSSIHASHVWLERRVSYVRARLCCVVLLIGHAWVFFSRSVLTEVYAINVDHILYFLIFFTVVGWHILNIIKNKVNSKNKMNVTFLLFFQIRYSKAFFIVFSLNISDVVSINHLISN